jgi:methionyl-tRNA formyltransferase
MDLVFCGTPMFAVPTLEKLVDAGFRVKLVVTQPDRASGRGMELAASPVKRSAIERGHPTRGNHRCRLWPDYSAVDDRSAEAGKP